MYEFSGVPLLLIIIGVGYLLANFGIISVTPWQILLKCWPIFLVIFGARILIKDYVKARFRQGSTLVFSIILITWGMFLLLPRLGFTGLRFTWSYIWPIGLIIIGFSIILKPTTPKAGNPNKNNSAKYTYGSARLVGDIKKGTGEAWYLEDTDIRHKIGEVQLDLTNAVIPDREVFLNVQSAIGNITIYIPRGLPVKTSCRVKIGEITVLGENAGGIHRAVDIETGDYQNATRKVNITASLKIGDIIVRRVG